MPRRKYKKRRYKKRTYRRKKRSNFNRRSGPGLTRAFPIGKKFVFKTRYFDRLVALNPGAGGLAVSQVYSLNGLFDPDISGVGHQPIGFDQIMPLYDHYTVIGARARVTFSNTSALHSQICMLHLKDSATTSVDVDSIIENGLTRYSVVGPLAADSVKSMTINCSVKKFFSKNIMDENNFQGTITSNPSEQVYLHLTVAPMEGLDSSEVNCNVLIEYVAVLTEPKQLASS